MMNEKDFYRILGVSEDASVEEIKKSYRNLAKKYHPDRNKGDRHAEERFKEINEAYDVLSDPEKRKKYDQLRKFGAGQFAGQGVPWEELFRQFGGAARGSGTRFSGSDFDFSGTGFDFGFGDWFSSFFDQGDFIRRSRGGPRTGADIQAEVTIPFETAVAGGQVQVTVPQETVCSHCNGSAAEPGTRIEVCSYCQGRGTVSQGRGGFAISRPCPRCLGRGKIITKPCQVCGGTGSRTTSRTIAVQIPAGIEDGATLRLAGQGNAGLAGGAAGDLLLTVHVEEDRFFKRKGANVHVEIPLNMVQAILGTTLRIRTPQGRKVLLRIPAGTDSGRTFRLRGMGIKSARAAGDMFVTVKVETPKNLTAAQRELIQQFARATGMKY
ncbi:MAG: molecular chaperone DnaJ [candidate division KSB1 bacterium]|nr:molecular chaperone DnaJ [candidate division KSB1 bacterium]MDZ7273203.1 molecular chaperone DnaJ [candidate division KSB1 bacterium]MDZ7285305.1 molecular chaperone DnaJ [candidate division KSB1 bacterium]MDZ7298337.1 molecular chaperone DnaJ [candidate division KSB1 bacterium]MDZ7349030.1 molecular chaperone DnaJ [candidate division KSB1 bacterium]